MFYLLVWARWIVLTTLSAWWQQRPSSASNLPMLRTTTGYQPLVSLFLPWSSQRSSRPRVGSSSYAILHTIMSHVAGLVPLRPHTLLAFQTAAQNLFPQPSFGHSTGHHLHFLMRSIQPSEPERPNERAPGKGGIPSLLHNVRTQHFSLTVQEGLLHLGLVKGRA